CTPDRCSFRTGRRCRSVFPWHQQNACQQSPGFFIKAESELIFAILALHLQFVYRFAAVHGPPLFNRLQSVV
ncbi:MAG: hypothetical protein II008_06980, partial [Oscillospiraceae bacterium]|nr:hypothetical protein [Oscillospiraceae bacterium]